MNGFGYRIIRYYPLIDKKNTSHKPTTPTTELAFYIHSVYNKNKPDTAFRSTQNRSSIMARTVAIGAQYFEDIRENNCFYIDKTNFIKE